MPIRSGIINVYKEKGFTSFDVIAKLRGILKERKLGHTGTLDPDATGVLPVCVRSATKVCDLLTEKDKTYVATMQLGITTDTLDLSGQVLSSKPFETDVEKIREAILFYVGEYDQVPPMYSALKVNGQKLCDLARAGKEVERQARRVTIHSIEILRLELPEVEFRVHCSKGTYIRSLCDDIGRRLGCGAAMKTLVRTQVSVFSIEGAYRLDRLEQLMQEGRIDEAILPVDCLFDYPKARIVGAGQKKALDNGNRFAGEVLSAQIEPAPDAVKDTGLPALLRVYYEDGTFAAIYERTDEGDYKPLKMFLDR